jgi:hypothetical protein
MLAVGIKSRGVIRGSQIRGPKMTAEHALQRATEAVRAANRAEAYACRYGWKATAGPLGGSALELFRPVFRPLTPYWTVWTPYNTLGYAEKVRSQFLSLRQPTALGRQFGRTILG